MKLHHGQRLGHGRQCDPRLWPARRHGGHRHGGFDRLSKTRYPLPTQGSNASSMTDYEQLGYDPASNITSRRLRDGQSIGLTYDNLGRLTSAGQTGHALSFTYDALSRNLTQVGPQGTVVSQWDLGGRRTKLTYPGSGLYLDYDYLITGEMTKIRENGATSGVGVLATYAYDNQGRRTSLTFGNGVVQAYGYDPVSRLASLTNELSGTTNDLGVTFAYNPASQIASTVRNGDAYAWTAHYNQNRNYTANGLNQYTASGAITPTYDSKGNLSSAGNTTYAYLSENMLVSASGGTSASLSYDPGRRLYQLTSGASTTRFAYDGLDQIAEYDGSNALLRRHVHGPGMDQPIVWYEGSGTTDRRFLSSDERGSIVSLTDGTGALIYINSYDEYGIPGSSNAGRFQYTGQAWLPELGMQYSKARIYSPTLGRFLQTDPIGYAAGPNLYAYVLNDPVNLADPLGLAADDLEPLPTTIVVMGQRISPWDSWAELPKISFGDWGSLVGNAADNEGADGPDVTVVGRRPPRRTGDLRDLIRRPWSPRCPRGPRVTLGYGGGLTAFGLIGMWGISASGSVNVSIPVSAWRTGLSGIQVSLSGSGAILGGLGAFFGVGSNPVAGFSSGPLKTGVDWGVSDVLQGGAAWGVGGEMAVQGNFQSRFPSVSGGSVAARSARRLWGIRGRRPTGKC